MRKKAGLESNALPPRSKTILCVDDEVSGITMRKLLLESVGYHVLVAQDGPSGLKTFASGPIDAVVLDYYMPGMNGDAVAREMRQCKPRVPILLLSASLELPPEAHDAVDAFVTKGDSPGVLFKELDRLLQVSHTHSEWEGKYVAFAGPDRRYTEVTEHLANLLGYARADMLQMTIDQLVELPDIVPELWTRYLQDGYQEGEIHLRRRNGDAVLVHYRAKIFPDGCMLSRMEPVERRE